MKTRIILGLLCWFTTSHIASAQWNTFGTNRTITVSGSAQVKVAPDQVELLLGVETFDAALETAKHDNDLRMNRVLAALKGEKIASRFVQTDNISVEPHYWNNNSISQPTPPK